MFAVVCNRPCFSSFALPKYPNPEAMGCIVETYDRQQQHSEWRVAVSERGVQKHAQTRAMGGSDVGTHLPSRIAGQTEGSGVILDGSIRRPGGALVIRVEETYFLKTSTNRSWTATTQQKRGRAAAPFQTCCVPSPISPIQKLMQTMLLLCLIRSGCGGPLLHLLMSLIQPIREDCKSFAQPLRLKID